MNISKVGIDLIKSFEGCRLYAYKPVPWEQYYTIGWGHYGSDVYEGMTITQRQADDLLLSDLTRYIQAVNNAPLGFRPNQNQFDALCSFCYNLGAGIMEDFRGMSSTQVSNTLPLYVNAGGNRLEGLVRRRKEEQELFNKESEPIKEVKKVDYIIQYSNCTDMALAEVMADRLNCPTINSLRPFSHYDKYKTVINIGEGKNKSGYTNLEIKGKDRKDTLRKIEEYLSSIGK